MLLRNGCNCFKLYYIFIVAKEDFMIKNIELKKDNGKGSGGLSSGAKACLVAIIVIFAIYFLAVGYSIFYSVNSSKESVAITSKGGTNGSRFYQTIVFYNLKPDNSSDEIYLSDFKLYSGNYIHKAVSFNGGKSSFVLVRDSEEVYVQVEFVDKNIDYSDVELYYKNQKLETKSISLMTILFPIIAIETVIFAIVMITALSIIRVVNDKKLGTNSIKAMNEKVLDTLDEIDFEISRTFLLPSPRTGERDIEKMMLLVDNTANKFAFIDYSSKRIRVVDFSDFVGYKIIENNGVNVESKMHYNILLNSTYSSNTSSDICKKLQLLLIVNDENDTNLVYDFVRSGVGMDSEIYRNMSKALVEVTSYFEIINKKMTKGKKFVYCKYCGVKNSSELSHCSSCGSALTD